MTTRASGRWISAPIPWDSAAGRNPDRGDDDGTKPDLASVDNRFVFREPLVVRLADRRKTRTTPFSTLTPGNVVVTETRVRIPLGKETRGTQAASATPSMLNVSDAFQPSE